MIGPYLFELDRDTERVYVILDVCVWVIFSIDLLVKLVVAPRRWIM